MPNLPPGGILALLSALALAACSSERQPAECRSDDQCPAASRCQSGVCVADARPVAAIRPPGPVEEFALVQLDGSGSHDPDDRVTAHAWTVRPATARCEPPAIAGVEAVARVRFGCPGRYEVSLVVRDALGIESAPERIEVEVLPSSRAPVVIAGPDVSSDHLCSGDPLVCRPTDRIALSASTTAPGATLQWSVEPPVNLPLDDGSRRVRFVPGPNVEAPDVEIESGGKPISGDWIFRVEARDAYGVVGAAYTRVSVRNRLPIVAAIPPGPFQHAFDAARSRFTSSGEIAFTALDPDGDPLEIVATWRHVGDGGAPFGGELLADKVTFAVEVPYAVPGDALLLRRGPDLARTIELVARDVNRGEARAAFPIEIGNRPPEPAGGTVDLSVPHTFDAARSRYVATARLGAWVDPDGDPISVEPGAAPCETISVLDGTARVECSVAYEGTPAVDRIAGRRSVPVVVHDPWSAAPKVVYGLEVLNRPPAFTFTTDVASIPCWVKLDLHCAPTWMSISTGASSFTMVPNASDPDGDPVAIAAAPSPGGTASPQLAVCASPGCVPFRFVQPAQTFCATPSPPLSRVTVSDGAARSDVLVSPRLVQQ